MDHLSELKQKLEQNKGNRNNALEIYDQADHAVRENELKLQRKVATLLESEKMELASYREIIKGSVDRLNHQQLTNNEYLAELNHNLNDMSDLKALYATKREIMEQNHQELVTALEDEENRLKREICTLQDTNKELNEEYGQMNLKLQIKKQADKLIAITLVVFAAVAVGSFLGIGFVDVIKQIGNWLKDLLTP